LRTNLETIINEINNNSNNFLLPRRRAAAVSKCHSFVTHKTRERERERERERDITSVQPLEADEMT
jgi:hypothetical protein